MVADRFENLFI